MSETKSFEETRKDVLLKELTERFLMWKLPSDFCPDAGISFVKEFNKEYNEKNNNPPQYHAPVGTNLFSYTQAYEMLASITEGLWSGSDSEALSERLSHIIDRDRYVASIALAEIKRAVESHRWLLEGRGPYAWDDDRYRLEFTDWVAKIDQSLETLKKLAEDKSDCTTDPKNVEAARYAALSYSQHTARVFYSMFGDPQKTS